MSVEQSIYINFRSVSMSVCNSRSSLQGDQPWQVMYQKKAHNPGKVEIIFLRTYNQQKRSLLPK